MSSKLENHGRDGSPSRPPSARPRHGEQAVVAPYQANRDIATRDEQLPTESFLTASCPLPITNYKQIVLAHGSGGKLSHQLIEKMVLPQFHNELLEPLHDGAIFSLNGERVAFSTDSFVVSPIFFPGGDIGKLAVHGTDQRSRHVRRAPALSLGQSLFWKKVCRWKISGVSCNRCTLRLIPPA